MSTLSEFLKSHSEKHRTQAKAEELRKEWVGAVERLMQQLKAWIRDADTERVIEIRDQQHDVEEESLGPYTAPALLLLLDGRIVIVSPKGRQVVGRPRGIEPQPQGRVDLTNRLSTYSLYRVVNGGQDEKWLIVDDQGSAPRPFDRKAFEDALQSLFK